MIGLNTIGNATIIAYDKVPIIATDPWLNGDEAYFGSWSLSHKIPIISTNSMSGPKEILSNGKYGYLVPVNNHFALAKKIVWIIKNYNYALNKANKGFKSLSRFEYKKQCQKYTKFIEKINSKKNI